MSQNPDPQERYRTLRAVGMLSTAGLTMALSVAIGVGIGYWLDQKFKTGGLLVIVFAIVGIIAGFQQLFKIVSQANADQSESEGRERRTHNGGPPGEE
ncbi:MAG: AtpZ/AtpI family protein [Actinomycetota bacterium]